MKHFKALVMLQLKNKLDFGFTATKQKLIAKIVFTLLKFVAVCAVAYAFFLFSGMLNIFSLSSRVPKNVMTSIFAIILLLSTLSCTGGLVKNLYFADDNKVLITFPVNSDLIFVSRLTVYYVFELLRSAFFTVPIFIGFGIHSQMGGLYYLWIAVSFVFVSALPVLFGAILSIPAMYVYRFLKKNRGITAVIYVAGLALVVFALVRLIALIPENINLNQQMGTIQRYLQTATDWCAKYCYPANMLSSMMCGYISGDYFTYTLFTWQVPAYFGLLLVLLALLVGLAFGLSRPLFFNMMSKSFEFEKRAVSTDKPNRKRKRYAAFLHEEITSGLRSGLLGNFVSIYLAVPILVFLLNKIFAAMDTRLTGLYMIYSFNLLLILLPMLASNAMVATLYSREGRAAYVKKTMPVNAFAPLFLKLLPIIVVSAISLVVTILVFNSFAKFGLVEILMLSIGVVLMQWGHVLWCGISDLMNPMNEQYATSGEVSDNPNEKTATVSAFLVAAVFALFSYKLFSESVTDACAKLMFVGVLFAAAAFYMYYNKIKVYYAEK